MEKYSTLFCDTSALMSSPEEVERILYEEHKKLMICSTVLDELDKHKDFGDGERNYQARQAFKMIRKVKNDGKLVFTLNECAKLPGEYDMSIPDNKILACLMMNRSKFRLDKPVLATFDNGMKAKADLLGIPYVNLKETEEEEYKGYKEIFGSPEEIDDQLYQLQRDKELLTNEYVIMHEMIDGKENISIGRWNGAEFIDCYAPEKCPVKPMNGQQMCAIDLMYNHNIPIKIIAGGYGSGN